MRFTNGLKVPRETAIAVEAARGAIDYAVDSLREVPAPIDAESFLPDYLSDQDRAHLLSVLLGEAGPADPADHFGDPAIELDNKAHQRVVTTITSRLGNQVIIAGEEASPLSNEDADNASDGQLIFLVDAIDGSEHADCFGFGFSSNILVLRAADSSSGRHREVLASLTVNSSRHVVGFDAGVGAFYGTVDKLQLAQDFNRPTVSIADDPITADADGSADHHVGQKIVSAVVGAKPGRHQNAAQRLMRAKMAGGGEHRVYTTGGAPMGPGMAMGRLDALVQPNRHPVWDSTHVLGLAALGAVVLTLPDDDGGLPDGTRLTPELISELMSQPGTAATANDPAKMPPLVVARDQSVAESIVAAFT